MTAKNSCGHQVLLTSPKEHQLLLQKDKNLNLLNVNPSLKGLTIKTKDDKLAEYIDDFSFKQ